MQNISVSFLLVVLLSYSISAATDAGADAAEGHWFYMVKTKSADPAKEAEFNTWYDDIDIPDVLAVPGFMRARRGVQQNITAIPELNLQESEGKYIALYDIETGDIDKSIIDLYVAARKMVALGRITDLLKVTEANYYRRLTPGYRASVPGLSVPGPDSGNKYIYIQKVLCCVSEEDQEQFLDWLENIYIPKAMDSNGINRINVYELYRIMEVLSVGPEEIPHLLLVHEIETDAIKQAISELSGAVDSLEKTARLSELYVEGNDSAVYRQMSDVKSE